MDAGNTFSSTNTFTGKVTFGAGGISHDGAGLKHSRGALILPAGSTGTTQLSWATAFADANYTATCQAQDPNSGGNTAGLKVIRIETFTASSITVDVANDAGVQRTGSLHCIAIHD